MSEETGHPRTLVDFEAIIRIYPPEEGGRRTPAFNGIRWDFAYAEEEPSELYMIWPDFLTEDGQRFPADTPLPVNVELRARMVVATTRLEVHRNRIAPGVRFFCHEGGRRVAEGIII